MTQTIELYRGFITGFAEFYGSIPTHYIDLIKFGSFIVAISATTLILCKVVKRVFSM